MHLEMFLSDEMVTDIIVRAHTERRLMTTCFRGMSVKCAGNFMLWTSAREVLQNAIVLQCVLAEIRKRWHMREFNTGSLCIDCDTFVGWESTDLHAKYSDELLESFHPNRRSVALRIKTDRKDLRAQKTKKVTLVFELKDEFNEPAMIIHSIYPGFDIGELDGDVTAREKRVFFDFKHPGE